MLKALAVASLAVTAHCALAQERIDPAAWMSAKPASSVKVAPTAEPGVYLVSAKVSDLATDKILATPELRVVAGAAPATFELGIDPVVVIKFVVSVAADGRSAEYTSEVRRNRKVESAHSATLALAKPG